MPPKPGLTGANNFSAGDHVFFKHPNHSWVVGKVTDVKDTAGTALAAKVRKLVTCKADDELRQCTGEVHEKLNIDNDVAPCREDLLDEQPHDLLSLTVLHDATLLRCLYSRYMADIIYTNIGAIVVALNPFNFKIPRYMDTEMPKYLAEGNIIEKNVPHSWAQAHNTYYEMTVDKGNQCILISGESGAGKTEATKIVMKYLAQVSSLRGTESERNAGMAVGGKMSACSPILESFGNARTVRNDNSSRFGKFMKVKFDEKGFLMGAHTTKYLLEKSRIITAAKNERVYHSFYIAARGSMARDFGMEADVSYKSLTAGQCMQNSEFNTSDDFNTVISAMKGIGMQDEEIKSVWAATCGILSSLNINFLPDGEGSKIDDKTMKYLDKTVQLWKVNKDALEKEFRTTVLDIAGEKTTKVLRPELAIDIRDATAKATYNALFGELVEKCNEKCDVGEVTGNWIGLLDIFGFEDFEKNSFEQLCINLANETLQNHYNSYIFTRDMEECKAEGIDVTDVKCPDNKPCLDMISAKGGIMSLLDEECTLGKATDLTFIAKVDSTFNKHAFYDKKKSSPDHFIIKHYAADVSYDVKNWLEKNRDTLKDDIKRCLRASEDALVKELLEAPLPPEQKKGKVTVGGFFKDQVHQLLDVINSTNPHWIRCVKPHPAKKALMFDGVQTMNQLESSGVLGTVKIRKAGYPIRVVFDKFTIRYKIIALAAAAKKQGKELCVDILKNAQMEGKQHAQIGKTKVFMKAEAFPLIERKRNEALQKYVLTLQRFGQGYISRVQTNKDWCNSIQRNLAALFVKEYREYMERSKAIREERARIRREIEERFRGLKMSLERDFDNFFDQQCSQYQSDLENMKVKLEKDLEAERKRQEQWKSAREAFNRSEYVARMRLFDESLNEAMDMQAMYDQELNLFRELELACVEESAKALRTQIADDEREARNVLWRGLQAMQASSQLDAYLVFTLNNLDLVRQAETISWDELHSRMRLMKQESKIRMTFRADERGSVIQAHEREKAHKIYDRQKDKELQRLRSLYNEEMNRVDEQRRIALNQLESPGGLSAAGVAVSAAASSRVAASSAGGGTGGGVTSIPATGSPRSNQQSAAIAALFGTPSSSPARGSALGGGGGGGADDANSKQQQQQTGGVDPSVALANLQQYSPSLVRATRESYSGADGAEGAAKALDTLATSGKASKLLPNEHAHWYDIDSKLQSSSDRALQSALASRGVVPGGVVPGGAGGADRSGSGSQPRTHSAGASHRGGQSSSRSTISFYNPAGPGAPPATGASGSPNSGLFRMPATMTTSPSSARGSAMANIAGTTQLHGDTADGFLFGAPPPRMQPPIIPRGGPQQVMPSASPIGRLTSATAEMSVFGTPSPTRYRRQ